MSAAKRTAAPVNDNSTSQPASQTFTIPSTAAVGDIIVFAMGQNTGTQTFDAPAGWTSLHVQTVSASNMASQLWAKKLTAGDLGASVTFTTTGGGRMVAGYLIVQGAGEVADIVVATPTVGTSISPVTMPTLTTTQADCLIAEVAFVRSALATQVTLTPGTGLTEDAECNTSFPTSPNFALGIFHRANSGAAGSYGGGTVTPNQAITGSHSYTLAIPSAGSVLPTGDTGLRVKVVKEDGTIISVYVYAVQADGSLALLSSPA